MSNKVSEFYISVRVDEMIIYTSFWYSKPGKNCTKYVTIEEPDYSELHTSATTHRRV